MCQEESPYHESLLLLSCLEAPMTKFGGCVNELQVNLLQGPAFGLHKQGLEREMPDEYAAATAPFKPPVHWLLLVTSMANASSVPLTSDFSCYHVQGTLDHQPSTLHLWPSTMKTGQLLIAQALLCQCPPGHGNPQA